MSELRIPFAGEINSALLNEELEIVMGDDFQGVSTGPGFIQFNDTKGVPANILDAAIAAAKNHDGTRKTAKQQAEIAKKSTMTDFVTAATAMQSQLTALIAANTADITALASDRDIPDALKPYLNRMMQRQAAAIQAQTGAFQVAILLAGQYAENAVIAQAVTP